MYISKIFFVVLTEPSFTHQLFHPVLHRWRPPIKANIIITSPPLAGICAYRPSRLSNRRSAGHFSVRPDKKVWSKNQVSDCVIRYNTVEKERKRRKEEARATPRWCVAIGSSACLTMRSLVADDPSSSCIHPPGKLC